MHIIFTYNDRLLFYEYETILLFRRLIIIIPKITVVHVMEMYVSAKPSLIPV